MAKQLNVAAQTEKTKKRLETAKPKFQEAKKALAGGKATPEFRKLKKEVKRAQRKLRQLTGKKLASKKSAEDKK